MKRPEFPFQDAQIDALLSHLEAVGLRVTPMPVNTQLTDPDDLPFVGVALSAQADCMVTGNKKHFRATHELVSVLSPAELMAAFSL